MTTALERALPIVASAYGQQFGVRVLLSGSDAFTDGDTITLPLLDNMSELHDVLFGYLAHESGHIRDTDFSVSAGSELRHSFLNIIEDIRIERLMVEEFPGTQSTLESVNDYVIQQGWSGPAKSDTHEAQQLAAYLLHALRSNVLNQQSSEPLAVKSREVIEQTFPVGFFVRLDGLLAMEVDSLRTTKDCLRLVDAILRALKDAEEEESQNQSNPGPGQSPDSGASSKDDGSTNGDQSGMGNDDRLSKPQSQTDIGSIPPGSDSINHMDNHLTDDHPSTSSSTISPSDDNDAGPGENGKGQDTPLHDKLLSATDQDVMKDAIDQLKDELALQAQDDNQGIQGTIDLDTNVGSPVSSDGDTTLLADGIHASASIRARLLGLLQTQTRQKQTLHTRGKRVAGSRLTRISTGDSRVFLQRENTQRADTAVHVLLDTSGSMGNIQDIANQATVSLSLAMSSIPNIDIAVSIFPGVNGKVSPLLNRGMPVRPCLSKFAVSSSGGTPLGSAMLFAARELAISKRERKVLIVITDGAPSDGANVEYVTKILKGHADIYAIGINSNAVSHYFNHWSVIHDVKELQSALFKLAGSILKLH